MLCHSTAVLGGGTWGSPTLISPLGKRGLGVVAAVGTCALEQGSGARWGCSSGGAIQGPADKRPGSHCAEGVKTGLPLTEGERKVVCNLNSWQQQKLNEMQLALLRWWSPSCVEGRIPTAFGAKFFLHDWLAVFCP